MTEKNIFAYKLFFSLIIRDFNLLLCENCNPHLKKSHLPLSQQPPSKTLVLSNTPFLKIWLEAQPPSPAERGGTHYDNSRLAKKSYLKESETLFER